MDLRALLAPSGELYAVAGSEPRPPYPVALVAVDPAVRPLAKGMYVLQISASGLTRENAAEALEKAIEAVRRAGGRALYAVADSASIKVALHGSPFAWSTLLALLPTLLQLAGAAILGVTIWQVIASVPSWVWACLVIGAALLIFGPAIGELVVGAAEAVAGKKEKEEKE